LPELSGGWYGPVGARVPQHPRGRTLQPDRAAFDKRLRARLSQHVPATRQLTDTEGTRLELDYDCGVQPRPGAPWPVCAKYRPRRPTKLPRRWAARIRRSQTQSAVQSNQSHRIRRQHELPRIVRESEEDPQPGAAG